MTAEENWAGYFRNTDRQDQKPNHPREHARYGVATERSRYGWELAASGADEFARFDASTRGASPAEDYRNEPNGFGWMVEIDPFDPGQRARQAHASRPLRPRGRGLRPGRPRQAHRLLFGRRCALRVRL
jgi:secreted PhoX family phosphatase